MTCFTVDERMRWAQGRNTKREEDVAYSLLGIFDVQMPLLYGEGREKAWHRLRREIREHHSIDLPVATGASFDSHNEEHNARCLPNTRTELLDAITTWANNKGSKPIFWLSGMAGTGKSTMDAMDECEREEDIRAILQLLAKTKDVQPVPLRIVVTSRPELHIRLGFQAMPNGMYQDLVLHEVPRRMIKHDIRLFLEHELGVIREERKLASDWPTKQQILALVELAVPLFIYAATMCQSVGSKGGSPTALLNKILQYQKATSSQLDRTYLPVLDQLLSEQEEDKKKTWL
jgi:hypothetical protein